MNIIVNLAYECWIQVARLFNLKRRKALFVALLGRPNAGKGTIASKLSERHGIPHISTGNLLRRKVSEDAVFAAEWGPHMKAGKLVPDWVVFRVLSEELSKPIYDIGGVLDGFPRNVTQAKMLRRMLAWRGNQIDVAIYIDVDRQDLMERSSGRRTCSSCGRTYHITFNPSKVDGVCDAVIADGDSTGVCGGKTVQREDDRPEVVAVRFEEFDRTFAPLHRYYEDNNLLVSIRANNRMGIEQVLEAVVFAVEEVD
jgi:adenylate kinase